MLPTLATKLKNTPLKSSDRNPANLDLEAFISLENAHSVAEDYTQRLPEQKGIRCFDVQPSPDGKTLAFSFRKQLADGYEYGVSLFHVETGAIEHLIPASDEYCTQVLWHPNGKTIVAVSSYDDINFGISTVDVKSKNRNFVLADWTSYADIVCWAGENLLVNSEFNEQNIMGGAILNMQTGRLQYLVLEDWPTRILAKSPTKNQYVYRQSKGGIHHLFLLEEDGEKVKLPIPSGTITAAKYVDDGEHVQITRESADSPPQTWIYDISSGQLQQTANPLEGTIAKENLVQPQLVTYSSFDETPIAAFAYLPPKSKPNGSHPAIIYLHGGPTGQQTNEWNPEIQYLISLGYVVVAPNFRGSTGFGKQFQNANFKDLGGGDLKDIAAAADFAVNSGYADPNKLVVMGHSYGGFLAIKAMTEFPTRWAAGIAQMPFVNMANAVGTPFLVGLLGNVTQEEAISYSPLSSIPKLQAPLLVQTGEHDTACTPNDATEMQRNSNKVKVRTYKDEGHNLEKKENKVDSLKRIAQFLEQQMP